MVNLQEQAKIAQKMINGLIKLLDSQGTDTKSLKETYLLIDMIEDDSILEKVLLEVGKTLKTSMKSIEATSKKIQGVKNKTEEKIENYKDTKESEELINNL